MSESFIVDLIEITPEGSGGRSVMVEEIAVLRMLGPWWGRRRSSYWVLFVPTSYGEVLIFIFLGVKETWFLFFFNFVISDFPVAVYCIRRYYETSPIIRMCFVESANCGCLQGIVSGRPGPVPFSKSRQPTPTVRVNLIGLKFESHAMLNEPCSDASV